MLKLKTNKTSGITLIALVVTIIVLLILAGISIMMLTGDNGILTRAGEARDETIIGQEKEQVELAYISAAMKKLGDDVTANELQDELDSMLGDTEETDETKKKTNVKQNSNNTINVLFRATQHNYNVNQGKVAKVEPKEDGVYINGTNVTKGLSRLLSYNDTICENLYHNYYISKEQLLVEKFGQDYYEHEEDLQTDPNYMRINREATNDYIDTLVGYIDNQEIKNLLLSYKTDEGYSTVSITCSISGNSDGESVYSWDGGVNFGYQLYFDLRQYDIENTRIKRDRKWVDIYGHFGLEHDTETGAYGIVIDKNFDGVMGENDDDSRLSNDNDIKFVLNNEEYSNAILGIFKYLMDSIGVEKDSDHLIESSYWSDAGWVDCYKIVITDEEAERIEQAFQN